MAREITRSSKKPMNRVHQPLRKGIKEVESKESKSIVNPFKSISPEKNRNPAMLFENAVVRDLKAQEECDVDHFLVHFGVDKTLGSWEVVGQAHF